MRRMHVMIMGYFLTFHLFASTPAADLAYEDSASYFHHLSMIASLGVADYPGMSQRSGQTPLGRMAVATELLTANQGSVGLEAGIQNGNHMRLAVPQSTLDIFNSRVLQTTVKPMLDLLLTANTEFIGASLFFAQVKGGIAYRRWEIASSLVNNKSDLAGEIQAGLGCPITELTSLNLLYQGVFGANPKFSINALNNTGVVASIPIQHGVLLGFSVIA